MYYLAELRVRDFTSYRGVYSFLFCRGINLVLGSGGSGKTNLIRALEFALFGRTRGRSDRSLINYLHRGDCERRGVIPSCEVSAVFKCDRRDLIVNRTLLDGHDGLKQVVVSDSDLWGRFSVEGFERMVFKEQDIEPLGVLSMGESTPIIVLNTLAGNIGDGIGIAFLDCVFGRLACEVKVELLAKLKELGLEQIIVFESFEFERALLEEHGSNIVELPYQHLASG